MVVQESIFVEDFRHSKLIAVRFMFKGTSVRTNVVREPNMPRSYRSHRHYTNRHTQWGMMLRPIDRRTPGTQAAMAMSGSWPSPAGDQGAEVRPTEADSLGHTGGTVGIQTAASSGDASWPAQAPPAATMGYACGMPPLGLLVPVWKTRQSAFRHLQWRLPAPPHPSMPGTHACARRGAASTTHQLRTAGVLLHREKRTARLTGLTREKKVKPCSPGM